MIFDIHLLYKILIFFKNFTKKFRFIFSKILKNYKKFRKFSAVFIIKFEMPEICMLLKPKIL